MRKHFARAMYDQIDDTLTSITMQLRSAIQADATMAARVNGKLRTAVDPLQRGSGWARQVTSELGSVLLGTLGLAATIEWHLHQFQKCTGMLYELTVNNTAGFDLPEEDAAAIFDFYSEALSNVARHAAATRVEIALAITPNEVSLVVTDNGIGLAEGALCSNPGGLAHMRVRAQSLEGYIEVTGAPDAGTSMTVCLPVLRNS